MSNRTCEALIIIAGLLLTAGISYGLALMGEPQALWLWRDIIGAL